MTWWSACNGQQTTEGTLSIAKYLQSQFSVWLQLQHWCQVQWGLFCLLSRWPRWFSIWSSIEDWHLCRFPTPGRAEGLAIGSPGVLSGFAFLNCKWLSCGQTSYRGCPSNKEWRFLTRRIAWSYGLPTWEDKVVRLKIVSPSNIRFTGFELGYSPPALPNFSSAGS